MQETILGAAITLVTSVVIIRLKYFLDKKKESHNWYLDYYIMKSLDPIISSATVYSYIITLKMEVLSNKSIFSHDLTFDELTRLSSLTKCPSIHVLFNTFYIAIDQLSPKEYRAFSKEVQKYVELLKDLRNKLMNFQIDEKSDIIEIQKSSVIKDISNKFETLTEKTTNKLDQKLNS